MSYYDRGEDRREPEPGTHRGEWIEDPYGTDEDSEDDRRSSRGMRPGILLPGRRDLPE